MESRAKTNQWIEEEEDDEQLISCKLRPPPSKDDDPRAPPPSGVGTVRITRSSTRISKIGSLSKSVDESSLVKRVHKIEPDEEEVVIKVETDKDSGDSSTVSTKVTVRIIQTSTEMLEEDEPKKRRPKIVSEAEKKRRLERDNERRRQKRASYSAAEKEERLRKERERIRKRKENETEAEREEILRKKDERRIQTLAQMTPEEKKEYYRKKVQETFFRWEAKKATMTPEEVEQAEFQKKMKIYMRNVARKARLTPEEKKRMVETNRQYRKKHLANRSEKKRKERAEKQKAYHKTLSVEKKREYNRKAMSKYQKKLKETNPAKWKEFLDKIKECNRRKTATETPEQRHKRLLRCKVNQAKRKARMKMEEEGVSPEEVERRLEEVVREVEEKDRLERARNPVDPADYKPRENARKPKKNTSATATAPEQSSQFAAISATKVEEWNENEDVNTQEFPETSSETCTHDDYDEPVDDADDFSSEPPCLTDCPSPASPLDHSDVPSTATLANERLREDGSKPNPVAEAAIPPFHLAASTNAHPNHVLPTTIKEEVREASPLQSSSSSPLPTAIQKEKVDNRVICDECGKMLRPMAVKFHKFTFHNPNRTDYKCPTCSETLTTARSLWDHYLNFHEETLNSEQGESPYVKLKAGRLSSTLPQEKKCPNNSKIGSFICEHCGKKYTQKAQMHAHIKRVHFNQRFICKVCGKEEQTRGKLWKHKIAIHPNRKTPALKGMVVCEYCSEPVLRSYQLHVKKFHPENFDEFVTRNPILKKVYSTTKGKNVTLTELIRGEKIKCLECGKKIRADSIKRHMRNVHGRGTKAYPCQQCNKVFKQNYTLNEHIRKLHTLNSFDRKVEEMELIKEKKDEDGELIYSCSVCDERIFRKKDMGGHLLTSHFDLYEQLKQPGDEAELEERRVVRKRKTPIAPTREKVKKTENNEPVNCDECGKSLHPKALKRHQHLVHNQSSESNKCPKCEVCFASAITLWDHYHNFHESTVASLEELESLHERDLVVCEYCSKPVLRNYKQHVEKFHPKKLAEFITRGDDNLKSFPCGHCKKEFKTNSELNEHIRTKHTLDSFQRKVDAMKLIKPIPNDEGGRLLSCSLCDENLFRRKDMGAHLLSAHFEVYEQLKKTEYEGLWKCGECSEAFDTEQLFSSHVQTSHPSTTFYCSQLGCHKLFASRYFLRDHHRKQHPDTKCRNPLLNLDVEAPLPLPGFQCSRCNAKFLQKPKLVEHVRSEHPENFWPCHHCDLFGYTEQVLKNHLPECDNNPEKRVKVEKSAQKKCLQKSIIMKKRTRVKSETQEETESDDDNDGDTKRSKSLMEMGTRSSSRIKIMQDMKPGKKWKAKVAQGSLDDDKLNMEVKVKVERLTKDQIELHVSGKY